MPKKFKLREPPQKPEPRRREKVGVKLEHGMPLTEILRQLPEGIPPEQIFVREEFCWDCSDFWIEWEQDEHPEAYRKRLEKYERDRASYAAWYEDNKEAVDFLLAQKEERAKQQRAAVVAKAEKLLKAELARIEKLRAV